MSYNNDIIKELFNYIKNYQGEDFINMDLILKQNFNILFLITPRNCGKSVGTMRHILKDCYINNNEFLYIRNTEIELKTSNAIQSFYNYFEFIQPGLSKHFNIKWDGVYYDNNKKMGTFLYFSKSKNSKSQGELNRVKWIIYEEFINPDAIFKNCVNRFADIFKTYQRNNITKAIFLGNKDDLLENDFLINFGIDFNINKNHNQYIWKANKKILAILINKTIKKKDIIESQTQYELIFSNTTAEKYSKGGTFSQIRLKNVFSWHYHQISRAFEPIFKIRWGDCFACVGNWKSKGLYIKEITELTEFEKVREVCLDVRNINSNNELLRDWQQLDIILFNLKKDSLFYSSIFIREEFKIIINCVNFYERDEMNKKKGGL